MHDFTLFFVLEVDAWPWSSPRVLFSTPVEETVVQLIALPDGRFKLIQTSGGRERHRTFQRISLPERQKVLLMAAGSEAELELRLNSSALSEDAGQATLDIPARKGGEHGFAWDHPEARRACGAAMDRRRRWVEERRKRRSRELRVVKPATVQQAELRDSLLALEELLAAVRAGKAHFLGDVASRLRGLVHFDERSANYNPLLLRLAAYADLPLPLFAVPNIGPPPVDPTIHVHGGGASLEGDEAFREIVDLQDYLDRPAVLDSRHNASASLRELVLWSASSVGSAHFDEDMPQALVTLDELGAAGSTMRSHAIVHVAELVVGLGWWALSSLDQEDRH